MRSEAESGPGFGMTIHLPLLGVGKTGPSHNRLSHHMPRMEYKLCWVLRANHYCNLQGTKNVMNKTLFKYTTSYVACPKSSIHMMGAFQARVLLRKSHLKVYYSILHKLASDLEDEVKESFFTEIAST